MQNEITHGPAIHGVSSPTPDGPRVRPCANCGCEWVTPILYQKIQDFQVLLGQPAPPATDTPAFYLYECAKCTFLNQPTLVYEGQNLERRHYEELLVIIKEINERRTERHKS
jgi:hypothetical protein